MKQPEYLPGKPAEHNLALQEFESIGLKQLNGAELMDRREEKYVIPASMVWPMLQQLREDYFLLEIQGKRIFRYVSQYYDTADLHLFHEHRKGRLNRYKIRKRQYVDSGVAFFEVKFKDNHGRTQKSRIKTGFPKNTHLQEDEDLFLQQVSPYPASILNPTVLIAYNRITLVNKKRPERVTIDLNLCAANEAVSQNFENLAVIEIKQEKLKKSPAKQVLKQLGLRPGTLSKYCLGIISLDEAVKHNRLKPLFDRNYKPFLTSTKL